MASIKLFNSLSKKKEVFVPFDANNIKIYVCGPTVYSRPHIGNARSIVVYDLWFRLLSKLFPKVTYVRNITDIDDKINAAAINQKISIQNLTNKVLELFYQDVSVLNALPPTFEPKATQHIPQIIQMIEKLLQNNNAYLSEGHILFDVSSYNSYGQLSKQDIDKMIAGSRVEVANYKKNPLDFVLWKPANKNDDISSIFKSPWGDGRPGWHIECSAMSYKYLGSNFDIHGGGSDLQFPHHENEIAQSRCFDVGSIYAKYWVHNGFLTVNGEKMSKSLNNFFTIRDLLDKNISPMAIRYFLLATHYRKPLDFNEKALLDAGKSIKKFYDIIKDCDILKLKNLQNLYLTKIIKILSEDLNTPLVFSVLHQITKLIKSCTDNIEKQKLTYSLLGCLDFLGLIDADYFTKLPINTHTKITKDSIDEEYILEKIAIRKSAKLSKNWSEADLIRKELLDKGIVLEDLLDGKTKWLSQT
jgi:cysteinyl-tRNA synthetase